MQQTRQSKVLVIEDQPIAAADLREELTGMGYNVIGVAASGEEALRNIEKNPPDLVVLGPHFQTQPESVELTEVLRAFCNIPVTLSEQSVDPEPSGLFATHFSSQSNSMIPGTQEITKREKSFWLSTALNSAADGIAMVDPEGRVQFLNPVAQHLTGFPQGQAAGRPYTEVLHFEHQGAKITDDLIRLATLNEEPLSLGKDLVLVAQDGRRQQVEAEISAGSQDQGAFGSAVFTFRDVTQRKWEEYQHRQEYAIRAVERLAETTSHTLNNLLTTILGNAELVLGGGGLAPDHRESVTHVHTAALHAAEVTRQLSKISRKAAVIRQEVNINALIEAFLPLLLNSVPPRIRLMTDLDPSIRNVSADPAQLEQILFNLIINARDAISSSGDVTISTRNATLDSPERSRTPRNYVSVTVRDTGEGMSKETNDSMFEPFFTTRADSGHVGLGLSITQGIVRDYKGSLTVTTELGTGTEMTFTVPTIEADPLAYLDPGAAALASPAVKTVLVVEDDHAVRLLICKILEKHNYAVIEAEEGEDALMVAHLNEGRVDVLISDVVMPGISGPDLVRQFAPIHPETKFLLISGLSAEKIEAASSFPRGIEFLKKPFNQKELLEHIQHLLVDSVQ
jgi:two-component system cell cycle sensor histidine kinase/response regulator CckA